MPASQVEGSQQAGAPLPGRSQRPWRLAAPISHDRPPPASLPLPLPQMCQEAAQLKQRREARLMGLQHAVVQPPQQQYME